MVDYKEGERIAIIGGLYKKNRHGIYLRAYGTKMACVQVEGDSRRQRNLWLTSLAPINTKKSTKSTNQPKKTGDVVVISKEDYDALQKEIASLTIALKNIELKFNQMKVK